MAEKTQIHITVEKTTIEAIQGLLADEKRTFSQMAAILLAEALEARKALKEV